MEKSKLYIVFSVDDFAPAPGYGLYLTSGPFKYLKKLNDEFGAKFTMFSIPFLQGNEEYLWTNNKVWVDKINSFDWIEVAQHGLTHTASKPEWGAQELMGLNNEQISRLLMEGRIVFKQAGVPINGFKSPGWYMRKDIYPLLSARGFTYVADHFFGNKIIPQEKLYRVPVTFSIDHIFHDKYDDYLILHSHMNPEGGNRNAWNGELYEEVRKYLLTLKKKYDLEFITMSELVELQK